MTPERWQQIQELFHAALDQAPDDRAAFLEQACAGDRALRDEVESLLASGAEVGSFIEGAIQGVAESVTSDQAGQAAGRRIGPYKLIREIGRGGMGAVYLAERADDQYRKQVAVKLVKGGMGTDEILRRFRHERQILANLDHPNIARLLDGDTTEEGLPYFVMEHVAGKPIDQYCDARKLSIINRLKLFRNVCSAVHYAHQNLVVHRDLKPSNILVTVDGMPKLLDFGIAKMLHPEPDAGTLTATAIGQRPMTPDYASPEQVRGEPITTAADVYSLGVLLYELLTGHRPYHFKNRLPQEVERVISEVEPERPSTAVSRTDPISGSDDPSPITITPQSIGENRDETPERLRRRLAGDLDNIVLMALRKEPQRRYASVEQFSEDIRRHLEGLPVIARKDTFGYRGGKFIKRHKVGAAMAVTIFTIVIGFGITMAVQSVRIARERDRALTAEQLAADKRTEAESERDRAIAAERLAAEQRSEAERARDAERQQRQLAEHLLGRAEKAEQQATAETFRAKTEAETARRVSEFLVGLFEVSDPGRSRGNTITAREILDKGAARITTELNNQPKVQATLMATIGRVYESLGLYDSAAPLHEQAFKIRRQALGAEHPEVAKSLNDLAEVLRRKGDLKTAEARYREALAMQRKLLGQEHPDVAESLDNLAIVLDSKGDFKEAEPLFRFALAMRRELLGKEHAKVAESLNNLAELLRKKGDYATAEPLHREALTMRRKLLGKEHPDVAISLDNLAILLHSRGDLDAAEPLYRESLAIFRKVLGEEHPDLATNLSNLSVLLYAKGSYDSAEPLCREALAMRRKLLGEDHADVALSLNNLAVLLKAKGDYAGAEPLYREALSIHRKLKGEEHPNVAQAMHNLARLLHDKGDYAAAEPFYRQALELRRKRLPEGHPDIALSLIGLGQLLTDRAIPQSAGLLLHEALEIRRKTLPSGDWRIAEAGSVFGGCLVALQRYDQAEPLLLESYTILKAKRGERNRLTQETVKRLVALYEAWGKPEKVAQYRAVLQTSNR